jgi:UDP-glucose 4-epimerase
MRILVTGGAGFIGSHIVDAYLGLGHDVTVFDNLSTGKREHVHSGATFIKGDICDASKVKEVFDHGRFDAVNHHAAQMDVRRSVSDPLYDATVNILGGLNLLEQCRLRNVPQFVFASSGGAIYGEQDTFPADESHPTRPISPYGVAKLTTEHYLWYYATVHQLKYVSLRYANIYGPRQNAGGEAGVVAIFISKILGGEVPVINGDGNQTRDYVYVHDVVAANVLALQVAGRECYNIGTGTETSVNALFDMIKGAAARNGKATYGPAKSGEQLRSCLGSLLIEEKLGWKPRTSLKEGIGKTVEYFRKKERAATNQH